MNTIAARDIVEAGAQKFIQAIRLGDVAEIARLHTENARILPPACDMLQGRTAVQSYYQSLMDNGLKDIEFSTIDVTFFGEHTIREIGRFLITTQSSEGLEQDIKMNYVVSWEEEDGEYKVDVDIWS